MKPYLLRRGLDYLFSLLILFVTFPIIILALIAVFFEDRHNPIYMAKRIGKNMQSFRMIKIRTMIPNADNTKVDSTSINDLRVTRVGRFIRAIKLDEMLQFLNVLGGSMSIVGPRPNIDREVFLYTSEEKKLLIIRPGITDLASIIFSDLANILEGSVDPNICYNQLVRPWKSRFGLIYVNQGTTKMYLKIVWYTAVNIINRKSALDGILKILKHLNVSDNLILVATRKNELIPHPPLGSGDIMQSRDILD